jgi:hypothetical protein
MQAPFAHDSPPPQAMPHFPQFSGSLLVIAQELPHVV